MEHDFSNIKRGPVISNEGKTKITAYLDTEVVEALRARATHKGIGMQSEMNAILRNELRFRIKPNPLLPQKDT